MCKRDGKGASKLGWPHTAIGAMEREKLMPVHRVEVSVWWHGVAGGSGEAVGMCGVSIKRVRKGKNQMEGSMEGERRRWFGIGNGGK